MLKWSRKGVIKVKKDKLLKIHMNEDMAKKLSFICKSEGISVQNQILALVRQKISYFERVKGRITASDIPTDDFENI